MQFKILSCFYLAIIFNMEISLHFPGWRALKNGFHPQKDSIKSIIHPSKSIKFFFDASIAHDFSCKYRIQLSSPLDYLFGESFNINPSTYHGIGEYGNDFIPIYNYIIDIQRLIGFKSRVQELFKNQVSNFNFKGCSRILVVAACEA